MQKNKKHLYNFRRVLVTCFREITLVTSSRPTHRSAQCHWSQSSYSCRCMRSWDWRKLPLKEAQQRKIRNKVELEQNIYNTPTNMPLVGKLCMNNIKCNTSAARSRYTLFLYQAPDHVASENNTHHHTLYLFFLKVNDERTAQICTKTRCVQNDPGQVYFLFHP